jgi:hypothetical protein
MTKISDLSALTGESVDAANDLVTVVDMSEVGVARNKKMTFAELKTALGIEALAQQPLPLTFNFTDAGDAYFYADVAMTLTEQATSGTGTIAYEKSTTAAPSTFSSTTSPISLQAGAWLKVSASSVTSIVAVHLKRTA